MPIFNLEDDLKLLRVNDTCAIVDDGCLDDEDDEGNRYDGSDTTPNRLLWHKNLLSMNTSAVPLDTACDPLDSRPFDSPPVLLSPPESGNSNSMPKGKLRRRSSLYSKFMVNPASNTIRLSLSAEHDTENEAGDVFSISSVESKRERASSFSKTGVPRILDDFVPVRCLGEGAYGKVLLVKDSLTSKLYAMKQLKKAEILITEDSVEQSSPGATVEKRIERTFAERTILSQLEHPNIVKLFYSFHDNHKLALFSFAIYPWRRTVLPFKGTRNVR